MSTDHKALAERFVNALNAGDSAALDEMFAADVKWTFPGTFPFSGTHEGKQDVFEGFLAPAGGLFAPPAKPPIELHNIVTSPTGFAVEYTARMTSAIGNAYENNYVLMVDVTGSQIAHVREYNDTAHLQAACYR